MAAKSRACICSILVGLLALATRGLGVNITVDWTLQGILRDYNGTILELQLNDVLKLNCSAGKYANLYILSASEAEACKCDVRDSDTCQSLGECRNSSRQIALPIQMASGTSRSLRSYQPGMTYYFASFANSTNSRSFTASSGGECEAGFRLNVSVRDDSTPPTTRPVSSPPSSNGPTDTSGLPSGRPTVDDEQATSGPRDRPIAQGLSGGEATTSLKLLTTVSIVLCAIVAVLFRH